MGQINLEIVNLTPKFLRFYEASVQENADEARRWELWQEFYRFSATPPTEEGKQMARKLLNKAWSQYAAIIEDLKQERDYRSSLEPMLIRVANELQLKEDLDAVALMFVGAFENNAFGSINSDGRLMVCLPVEMKPERWDVTIVHELTHIVHFKASQFVVSWDRSIAETIVQEGLAIHMSKKLVPGYPMEYYIEGYPGWLNQCEEKKYEILNRIVPDIKQGSMETVFKLTMGNGNCGLEREAYYVGMLVVGQLLETGWTPAQIAHLTKEQIQPIVLDTVNELCLISN